MDFFSYQISRQRHAGEGRNAMPAALIGFDHALSDPERPAYANPIATAAALFRSLERRLTAAEPILNPTWQMLAHEARSIIAQQTTIKPVNDLDGLADLQIPHDALEANVLMSAKRIQLDQVLSENLTGVQLDRAKREVQAAAEREALTNTNQEARFSNDLIRQAYQSPAGRNYRSAAQVVAAHASRHVGNENNAIAEENRLLNEDERVEPLKVEDVFRSWRRSFAIDVQRDEKKWTNDFAVVMATNEESAVMKKFIDTALEFVEARRTPSKEELAERISNIRGELAKPVSISEPVVSSENGSEKAGVRVRVLQPAIDTRPHQWKRQAFVNAAEATDPSEALMIKARRVVGIEGQPFYDNVEAITNTLKAIQRQHSKFVDRQARLAERAVLQEARKAGVPARDFDTLQRAEDTAAQLRKNASLSIITHAPPDSPFAKSVAAAASAVGLGTANGYVTMGLHRQIVSSDAVGTHVDGAYQKENLRRVDITTGFSVERIYESRTRTAPSKDTVRKALIADSASVPAELREKFDQAVKPLDDVYRGLSKQPSVSLIHLESYTQSTPVKNSAVLGLLKNIERSEVPFMSGSGANSAAGKVVMVDTRLQNVPAGSRDTMSARAELALIANAALTPDRMVVFCRSRGNAGKMLLQNIARIVHRRALSGMSAPIGIDSNGQRISKKVLLAQASEHGRTMKEKARIEVETSAKTPNASTIAQRSIMDAVGPQKAALILGSFKTAEDAARHAEAVSRNPKAAAQYAEQHGLTVDALKAANSLRHAMANEQAYRRITANAEASVKEALERGTYIHADPRDPVVAKIGAVTMIGDIAAFNQNSKTIAIVADARPVSETERTALDLMVKNIAERMPNARVVTNAETPMGLAVLESAEKNNVRALGIVSKDERAMMSKQDDAIIDAAIKLNDKGLGGIASLSTYLGHESQKTSEHATRAAIQVADTVVLARGQAKDMVTAMAASMSQEKPFFALPRLEPIGNGYSGNDLVRQEGAKITSYMPIGRDKEALTIPHASVVSRAGTRELVATLTITNPARSLSTRKDHEALRDSLDKPASYVQRSNKHEKPIARETTSARMDIMSQIDFSKLKDPTYVKGLGLNNNELKQARQMHIKEMIFDGITDKIDLSQMQTRANVAEYLARNFKVTSRSSGREM